VLRLVDPTLGSEVAFVISLSAFHFNRIDRSRQSIAVSTELIFVPRSPSELIRSPRKLRRLLSDTSSTSEFVDALNGNREKRIPDRRIQRRYESLLADRPQSVGRSCDSLGEPLLDIDVHAPVAAIW